MDAQISQEFYRYLYDVIGTKEVVKARRQIFHSDESLCRPEVRNVYTLNSGSKAEGLDLSGSDLGVMQIIGNCSVYESSDEVDHSLGTIPLIMDVDGTCPGFSKLYVAGDTRCRLIDKCCVFITNKWYISSSLLINNVLKHLRSGTDEPLSDHGPCICARDEFDLAISFHSKKWISQANDFITRTRYSWANKGCLEKILQFGVLFVPIGSKRSPETDLEWRISFSFAEKLLIWSFNHVQLLCYALLKILLKEVIKKKMPDSSADLLCSYFLKTIMFWLCEDTEVSQWKPEILLSCFNMAFKRLLYCVENKTLLHYFIPENNLFKDRFTNEQYKTLMSNLKDLLNIGWTCLLETETLRSFRERITSSLTSTNILSVSFLPCLTLTCITCDDRKNMHTCVYFCIRSFKNTFNIYNVSFINQIIAQNIESDSFSSYSNKDKYNRYRKQMCHLLIGTNHDAVSGWLLLASFFLCNKQYLKCRYLINLCLSKLKQQDLILLNGVTKAKEHRFNLIRRRLGECRHADLFACKYFTAMVVTYNRSELIFPKELSYFVSKEFEFISPEVFAYYVKFMCDRHVSDARDRHSSLIDLIIAVHNTKGNTEGHVACMESALSLC